MARQKTYTLTYSALEDIVAVSEIVYGGHGNFEKVYNSVGRERGFPAVYDFIITAGLEFNKQAKNIKWGEDAEWPDSTEAYAGNLVTFVHENGRAPTAAEFRQIAKDSIRYYG